MKAKNRNYSNGFVAACNYCGLVIATGKYRSLAKPSRDFMCRADLQDLSDLEADLMLSAARAEAVEKEDSGENR